MTTWTSLKNPRQFTENGTATKPGYIRESLLIKLCRSCERGKYHDMVKLRSGSNEFYIATFLALKSNDHMCPGRFFFTPVNRSHRLRVSFLCLCALVLSLGASWDDAHEKPTLFFSNFIQTKVSCRSLLWYLNEDLWDTFWNLCLQIHRLNWRTLSRMPKSQVSQSPDDPVMCRSVRSSKWGTVPKHANTGV